MSEHGGNWIMFAMLIFFVSIVGWLRYNCKNYKNANKNLEEVREKMIKKKREENGVTSEYSAKKLFHCDGCNGEEFPFATTYKFYTENGVCFQRLCTKCTDYN